MGRFGLRAGAEAETNFVLVGERPPVTYDIVGTADATGPDKVEIRHTGREDRIRRLDASGNDI